MKNNKQLLAAVIGSILTVCGNHSVFAQSEKLGLAKYTPPKGWTKTEKENVVIFNEINQASGNFCDWNNARGASAPAQEPDAVATRFGALSVSEAGVLLFEGVPVRPIVEANNSLDFSKPYQIGASDVVLVTDNGGTACPALCYFVTVTKSGVRVTPSFGTCSDLIKIQRNGNSISVSMPGYRGSAESKKAQRRAARERHVFNYHAGVVTENGRPVK